MHHPSAVYCLLLFLTPKLIALKKVSFLVLLACLLSVNSKAQLMVSKMIGKDADKYGLGYGLFSFLDYPIGSGNQSLRLELAEFVFYPSKGENFFTSRADSKGYLSIRAGYKYVFSETQNGFYLTPSVGYCRVVDIIEGFEATYGDGIAVAMEGGYSLGVGERGHSINLGLKYETDRGGKGYELNSVGFRVSYAFNLFHPKDN
jgi:hypothetical protein